MHNDEIQERKSITLKAQTRVRNLPECKVTKKAHWQSKTRPTMIDKTMKIDDPILKHRRTHQALSRPHLSLVLDTR